MEARFQNLPLFTCLGLRMLGNVWDAKCYGNYIGQMVHYTFKMSGKMAGTSVIADFLNICGKIVWSNVSPCNACLKACQPVRWIEAARHCCVVGWCKTCWNHVPT